MTISERDYDIALEKAYEQGKLDAVPIIKRLNWYQLNDFYHANTAFGTFSIKEHFKGNFYVYDESGRKIESGDSLENAKQICQQYLVDCIDSLIAVTSDKFLALKSFRDSLPEENAHIIALSSDGSCRDCMFSSTNLTDESLYRDATLETTCLTHWIQFPVIK